MTFKTALEARRAWMTLMGLSVDEINDDCQRSTPTDLEEEIEQYEAMMQVKELNLKRLTMHGQESDMTREGLEVLGWLRRLPSRQLFALAMQHKIATWANKSEHQLVEELRLIPAVQEHALEMIQRGQSV